MNEILTAIKAANADGDYPTATDLADGLGRGPKATANHVSELARNGQIMPAAERGPNNQKRWIAA